MINPIKDSSVLLAGFMCVLLVVAITHEAGAQDIFNDPLSYRGGADTIVYNSDTVMLENTVMDDASGITPERNTGLSLSYLYSGYYMIGFLGLAWSPLSFMEINLSLPYIYRSISPDGDETYSKGGYGDTKLGVRFFKKDLLDSVDSTTSFNLTIPTGDLAASDRLENVPMGYGNVTTGIMESLSYRLPGSVTQLPFRFFMNLGTQFYANTTLEKNTTVREYYNWYFNTFALLGVEYSFLSWLQAQVKYNIIFLPERTYKEELLTTGATTSRSREDRLIASDIVFNVKFAVKEYVAGNLFFVLPVMELKDSSKPDGAGREWKIMLSLFKTFGTAPDKKEDRNKAQPKKTQPAKPQKKKVKKTAR